MGENGLTKEEQLLLKEYEIGEKLRDSYFRTSWVTTSIILPICFSLIGLSYTDSLLSLERWALIPLAITSFFLGCFWRWYIWRYAVILASILRRAREIEKELGLKLHNKIHEEDIARTKYRGLRRAFWLNNIMLFLLLIAWVVRIIFAPLAWAYSD